MKFAKFFHGVTYLWQAFLRLPIYFYLFGIVGSSFLLCCWSVYANIQYGATIANLEQKIALEEENIIDLRQEYVENLSAWESLSSPYSVKILVEHYLPNFKPAFVEHSMGDLPPVVQKGS